MISKVHLSFAVALCGLLAPLAQAGTLTHAEVTRIINDVKLVNPAGARPAVEHDVIKEDNGLRTGAKSRAELLFEDNTLARLGADTFFSFKSGTRDLDLGSGSMLLQVPKGLGGTKIRAAAITAAITGTTVLFDYQPGGHYKLIVLEGSVRLSVNGTIGQSVLLTAGKMVVMPSNSRHVPDPVDVDLETITKTSGLLDGKKFGKGKSAAKELPSMGLIEKEIGQQKKQMTQQGLIQTNLVMLGNGTEVILASNNVLDSVSNRIDANRADEEQNHVPATRTAGGKSASREPASDPVTPDPVHPVASGDVYHGQATDGSASHFFFGGKTAFDTGSGFEALGSDPTVPLGVLTFPEFSLAGSPSFAIPGAPDSLAIISRGEIEIKASPGVWDLTPLRGLLLATIDGSIKLDKDHSFTGSNQALFIYARGAASDLNLESNIFLPTGRAQLIAGRNANIKGDVTVSSLEVFAGGDIKLGGSVTTQSLVAVAGDRITIEKPVTVGALLTLTGKAFTLKSDLDFGYAPSVVANLTATDGGIDAGSHDLIGFQNIVANGPVKAGSLDALSLTIADGNLEIAGDLSIPGLVSSGDIKVGRLVANPFHPLPTALFSGKKIEITNGIELPGLPGTNSVAPTAGTTLTLLATSSVNLKGSAVNLNGGEAVNGSAPEGGNGGSLLIGTNTDPIRGNVSLTSPVNLSTGKNANTSFGGSGGSLHVVATDTVAVNSMIKVSDSASGAASVHGGNIAIESRKDKKVAISISNTGELLALLDSLSPGTAGSITLTSAGGDILVNGKLRADKGIIDVQNYGASGSIVLTNANLNANVVKVAALGKDGTLIIGGGNISADSEIKLYAAGSNGQVRFVNNSTLSGASVKTIAGSAVTINDGKVVTINGGAAKVYTDHGNYTGSGGNNSTTGAFGGAGATTHPFNQRPGF